MLQGFRFGVDKHAASFFTHVILTRYDIYFTCSNE